MIHDIVNTDDDIEMIMRVTSDGDFEDDDDDDVISTDGIIKIIQDVERQVHATNPKRMRQLFASLSIGLFVGTMVSTAVYIGTGNRGGSSIPTIFTSVIHEQLVCRRYPAPKPFAGKKGVAIGLNDSADPGKAANSIKHVAIMKSLRPYWNYGWSVVRSVIQPDDIEWVPMVWGGKDAATVKERIETNVLPHIQSGKVKRILGFNEPDSSSQSNVPVERALEIWPELVSTGVSVISPSCAHPASEWMKSFMSNATNTCKRVDWVAVHWYGSANFIAFRDRIRSYYHMYGRKPIIVTEFGVADYQTTTFEGNGNTREEVLSFMKQAVPWLETRSWVVGYAWFSHSITDIKGWTSALYYDDGQLTPLGQYYASVRKETPKGNQTIKW